MKKTILFSLLLLFLSAVSAPAQDDEKEAISQKIDAVLQSVHGPASAAAKGQKATNEAPRFSRSDDGYLRFLGAPARRHFSVTSVVHGDAEATARNFLAEHKAAFGITSKALGLKTLKIKTKGKRNYVRFQQTYAEIPAFASEIIVQLNKSGGVEYVLSDIMRQAEDLDNGNIPIVPSIPASEAEQAAISLMAEENPASELEASAAALMIYQPSVVGNTGPTRLVWQTTVVSVSGPLVDEFILVDAHTGEIALHYSLIKNAKYREIYDANNTTTILGILRRAEGDPPFGQADVDDAYDYLGDTYDFYSSYHDRNSIDDAGMTMSATVRYCYPLDPCPWPNAAWFPDVKRMYFGEGFAVDDVTAHELTHGVTEYESALLYMNESGAINESFSDMWGEWVDQLNGSGDDSPSVKWLMGEDIGAFRDMANPPAYGDPDRMGSPNWYNGPFDNGGVHTNSGVGNKLCYLLTDGNDFNGHTVTGMGIADTAELFYEVQCNLLSSGASYYDLYAALTQAAINLGWSTAERDNLEEACLAVEISVVGYCPALGNCDEYISGVEVGDISNTATACSSYADYTAMSTDMEIGAGYSMTVTNGNPIWDEDQCGIWVDWNQDDDFNDADETIAVTGSPGVGPYTATITPPPGAALGATRMRIRIIWDGILNPCGSTAYGEVEDYTVIIEPTPCSYPACWDYPAQCHGDTDNDLYIGLAEFFTLRDSWGCTKDAVPECPGQAPGNAYNPCADVNRDSVIGLVDFYQFRDNWQQTPPIPADCPPGDPHGIYCP
jgi:Zn-dependent metalloprotease